MTLPEGWMGAGRWLGLRLKHPGENGAVSTAQPFYAQPPTQWTGAGPGGAGGVMNITRPDGEEGDVTILGGWRGNLHGDATPELLLCGTDASGGWFAVVHLDENGALPSDSQEAVRSWSGDGTPAPYDARFACAVADLDNDGRDDLVVLAAPQNDRPSLVVHRGTGDAQVFGATGERLNWLDRPLNNTSPGSLELEVGPAAMVVCLDASLRTDRQCQNRKRLLLNLPEDAAGEAAGFESIGLAFIPPTDVLPLTEGRFVSAGGALSFQTRQTWLTGHSSNVFGVAFSPDGQTLASGSADRSVKLWNASTGALIRTLTGHTDTVKGVAFSPDGQTFASGSFDTTIKLWNASTGAWIRTLSGHTDALESVAFSPDGQTIVSGSNDTTIKLWNTLTGALIRTRNEHSQSVRSVAFSPDGQTIASGSNDTTIKLWNASIDALPRTLPGHIGWIRKVAFSPDGQTLASASYDNTIKLWNTSTGVLIRTLRGHADRVFSIDFSPNGATLASGGGDNTIKLWNASTGALVGTLPGHTQSVYSVAFSPDGQTLASGGGDHRIGIWTAINGLFTDATLSPGIGKPLAGQSGQVNTYLAAYSGNQIRLKRPYTWRPLCGDGAVDDGEIFDDGQPWAGRENTAQCGATCGDAVLQAGEDCDDGNDSNADACLNSCVNAYCGDGLVRQDLQVGDDGYESCDDGNFEFGGACAPDCNRCGDAIIGHFESCDDGNDVVDDGCSNCVLDSCGNGQLDQGEDCDDGDEDNFDACNNLCQRMSLETTLFSFDGTPGATQFLSADNLSVFRFDTNHQGALTNNRSKWGNTSADFSAGNNKYGQILPPHHNVGNFIGDDFTVEAWIYRLGGNTSQTIASKYWDSPKVWRFNVDSSNRLEFLAYNTNQQLIVSLNGTAGLSVNRWHHVAITRDGSSFRVYLDGIMNGFATTQEALHDSIIRGLEMGSYVTGNQRQVNGNHYVSDVRITKGAARYTANFPVPGEAFER